MGAFNLNGQFAVEHWYRGELIDVRYQHNDTTNQGKVRFFEVGYNGSPQITTFWLGLIDYTGYTAVAATDTYIGINAANGWEEFIAYTDTNNGDNAATRPLWTPNTAASGSIANTTKSLFTITSSTGVVQGLFVVGGSSNAQTKNDHSSSNSILWATSVFSPVYPVFIGSVLRIIYTVNL